VKPIALTPDALAAFVVGPVNALDKWATAKRGRSWETCHRADRDAWTAVAWENGTELASAVGSTPSAAREALAVEMATVLS
jgi:hypothetical protein